jgi:nicotinate-nucleotide adenylyltransferase
MSDPTASAAPRIGILGGTFDPIHLAHLVVAQEVAARLHLDRILFVPVHIPPHKRDRAVTPAVARRDMVAAAIADEPRFALCTLELERAGPSYTADTVAQLRASYGSEAALYLILGADMLGTFSGWHEPAAILRAVTAIAAVHRPDYPPPPADRAAWESQLPGLGAAIIPVPVPQLEISSTEVRDRVAQHLPIRYLVVPPVEAYIAAHKLYRGSVVAQEGGAR